MKILKSFICLFLAFLPTQIFAQVQLLDGDFKVLNALHDVKLLVLGGFFVLLMQAGFAVVEGGGEHNLKSIQFLCVNYVAAILGGILFSGLSFVMSGVATYDVTHPILTIVHGWHWNLMFFYTLMTTTITTVVGRIIPSTISIHIYALISFIIAAFIFPLFSSWAWGNLFYGTGWLKQLGFIDFAGSTVVHSIAAWIVLAGYYVLRKDQKHQIKKRAIIFGDYKILSLALAGFVLWLAWSGLNVVYISAIHVDIGEIVANAIAALVGSVLAALCLSLLFLKHMSWEALIKAALGGLVAITASCGFVSLSAAAIIGMTAGALTLFIPSLLKHWIHAKNIREVVVVHGVCGVWGTLAVALTPHPAIEDMSQGTLFTQSIGILVAFIWSFGISYILFKGIVSFQPKHANQID
ncbi:ammonium transporter [Acinetobacter sp. ANC 4648]|uniref:ammonium transporter n=1 Tax=Acinetobacter sp. ANC 4648 TaxID=1977875 RepID=UPI000A345FF4|nr:ammonium transporter [Acinetobacter sp. ANC 4648]OTG83971.1 ammonium transporter [Acinetobacter sp. ANC 4648]